MRIPWCSPQHREKLWQKMKWFLILFGLYWAIGWAVYLVHKVYEGWSV